MIWEEETRGKCILDHNRLVRQAVQRPLVTVNRAWSYSSTLSGLSTKSWPDLPSNLWLQLKLKGMGV